MNRFVEPLQVPEGGLELIDPRNPPKCRLTLHRGDLASPTQVCMFPGATFELPQAEAFRRGRFLLAVADPVSLLRESTELLSPARLTLRLRDHDPDLAQEVVEDPGRLRVFRKDSATAVGVPLDLSGGAIEIEDFCGAKGVSFPIMRFGTYLLAFEKDR